MPHPTCCPLCLSGDIYITQDSQLDSLPAQRSVSCACRTCFHTWTVRVAPETGDPTPSS